MFQLCQRKRIELPVDATQVKLPAAACDIEVFSQKYISEVMLVQDWISSKITRSLRDNLFSKRKFQIRKFFQCDFVVKVRRAVWICF